MHNEQYFIYSEFTFEYIKNRIFTEVTVLSPCVLLVYDYARGHVFQSCTYFARRRFILAF